MNLERLNSKGEKPNKLHHYHCEKTTVPTKDTSFMQLFLKPIEHETLTHEFKGAQMFKFDKRIRILLQGSRNIQKSPN